MTKNSKREVILGVDPGTLITGYGLISCEDSHYTPLDYGCIKPPKSLKLTDRYLIIFNSIEELIEKYAPHTLVVETQYVHRNVQVAIKLGMARGAALLAAARKGISVVEYPPTVAKKAVVGSGRASKQQVQRMIQSLLSLKQPPEPDDAADALALAICHAHGSLNAVIKSRMKFV